MAKKPLLSLPINAQLVSNCKSLAVEGGWDDYLFWMNAPNFFFSCKNKVLIKSYSA